MKRGFVLDKNREDAEQKPLSMTHCLNRGFTLIELLVVVLIIGILSAVALPQYRIAVAKAKYTKVMPLLRHYINEQNLYYLANGTYAATWEELGAELPAGANLHAADRFMLDKDYWQIRSQPKDGIFIRSGVAEALEVSMSLNGRATCIAYDRDEFAKRVCKSFGGVKTSGRGEGSSAYSGYTLPF